MVYCFSELPASKKLERLAKNPIDITVEGTITAERIAAFSAFSTGYKLIYALERVTEEVLEALKELSQEALLLEKMEKMQAGEVVNFIQGYPSDHRPALHTALRDFFSDSQESLKAKEAAALAREEVEKLRRFIEELDREGAFTDLLVIGIGGSELGPKANYYALSPWKREKKIVHFVRNIDPDNMIKVLKEVSLERTLVAVISKSGTTQETVTNEEWLRERYQEEGLDPHHHFVAITGEGSPMDNLKRYRDCFYLWDWVGGRFSCTSMGGGIVIAFACGFDVYLELLRGAHEMDRSTLSSDFSSNLPLLAALLGIWNRNFLKFPTLAVVPYSEALSYYPAHIQQVEMESNGKRTNKDGNVVDFVTGPIVWGEAGTNAQHSFFQLIHQGTDIIPLEFIGFKESQFDEDFVWEKTTSQEKLLANLIAQGLALAQGKKDENPNKVFPGNRPSHILLGKKLTPFALGALLSFVEHKVAFQGFVWNINSFDQEGVQLGKVLAKKILKKISSGKGGEKEEPCPLGEAFLNHLKSF